jgi:hypothetical protein
MWLVSVLEDKALISFKTIDRLLAYTYGIIYLFQEHCDLSGH